MQSTNATRRLVIFIIALFAQIKISKEIGLPEIVIHGIGLKMCMKQCIQYNADLCNSYKYHMDTFTCYLSAGDATLATGLQRTGNRTDIASNLQGPCFGFNCGPKGKCVVLHGGTPKCVIVNCAAPPYLSNAVLNSTDDSFTVNSVITYTCTYGFTMIGSPTVTCMANGQWKVDFICTDGFEGSGGTQDLILYTLGSNYVPLDNNVIDIASITALVFDVQTCEHAKIGLFEQPPTVPQSTKYEIILGGLGNSQSGIKDGIGIDLTLMQGSVLNCNNFTTFWIGWNGGKIKVGTGYIVGESMFMETPHFPQFSVSYAGAAGVGDVAGIWIFYA